MINFNKNSQLRESDEKFFEDCEFEIVKQPAKGTCVMATLSSVTKKSPEYFIGKTNIQNLVTWSKAPEKFGMKLQDCPTDILRVK